MSRELVLKYFRLMDTGDPAWLDLLADEVDFWYPKFGRVTGRREVERFGATISSVVAALVHDAGSFRIHEAGRVVVVEGTERGTLVDGRPWPDGDVSEGRFCNVFEVEGGRIVRLFIYLDPDLGSDDGERVALLQRVRC